MDKIAVIGGSCFVSLANLVITHSTAVKTPFGEPSAPLTYGILGEYEVVYLPRRGSVKPMPPHEINYRANIWALRDAGVQTVIATAAVAGIAANFKAGDIVVPDQLIDYTYGRDNTFLGKEDACEPHIEFSDPYSESLRQALLMSAKNIDVTVCSHATYGITQGPRFETRAEIECLRNEGCHIVGMTGMPEAALARELGLDYACLALVVRKVGVISSLEEKHNVEVRERVLEKLVEKFITHSLFDEISG